ncbi:hypothetical protein GDO86_018468 [Hymenochirus boettgeri]|nr:hypothetical protein GDO86_018468 [Hymenochirus boettgeri]
MDHPVLKNTKTESVGTMVLRTEESDCRADLMPMLADAIAVPPVQTPEKPHMVNSSVKQTPPLEDCHKKLFLSFSKSPGCAGEQGSLPPSLDPDMCSEGIPSSNKETPTTKRKRGHPTKRKNNLSSPALPTSVPEPMSPTLPTLLENGPPTGGQLTPEVKVPKKRGRKSKAESLMIKLAQEQARLATTPNQEPEDPEVEITSSGRPRRRAAKTALRYLQDLADDLFQAGQNFSAKPSKTSEESTEPTGKSKKRKYRRGDESEEDSDFVVNEDVLHEAEREEEEEESDDFPEVFKEELTGFRKKSVSTPGERSSTLQVKGISENGFHNAIMNPVWKATHITAEFRSKCYSDWEFPEWIPRTNSWHFLSRREAETYLPIQNISPPFTIRREGIKEEANPCTLNRFQSLPPHPQRSDMTFFVGGPVWSLEWCPTLGGSGSCQYLALYCHHGMDDRHKLDVTHPGPALLQLWSLGPLDMENR